MSLVNGLQPDQRRLDDVLLVVTHQDGRVEREQSAPGRAEYLLTRYTRDKFEAGWPLYVERSQ